MVAKPKNMLCFEMLKFIKLIYTIYKIYSITLNFNCTCIRLPAFMLLTVDAGAATFYIVIFLGSDASEETATGIAVAYSMPPAAETVVNWLNPSSL